MRKQCPVCGSKKIIIVKERNMNFLACEDCGYDERGGSGYSPEESKIKERVEIDEDLEQIKKEHTKKEN